MICVLFGFVVLVLVFWVLVLVLVLVTVVVAASEVALVIDVCGVAVSFWTFFS